MVEAIEMMRPTYNAVNINIRKPEVNKPESADKNDNGIYNSVKVDIDNPKVNSDVKKVYDYPEAEEVVTYDKAYSQPVALPQGYPVVTQYESSTIVVPEDKNNDSANDSEVPEPNYTTLEAEKKTLNNNNDSEKEVSFHGAEPAIQKPEIVPSVDIKPAVDVSKVVANLNSDDFDTQALQMKEIIDTYKKPELAKEYIVSDVFSALINVAQKDTNALQGPTKEQEITRKKIMESLKLALSKNEEPKLPDDLTEKDIAAAVTLMPLEMAERNKEYALITMAMLDKMYIDGVQKENGNVVALTDVPGVSAMVDAIRYSKNPVVKIAAIDSLRYISRPEYKNELSEIFTISTKDSEPAVAEVAAFSLNYINKQK